MTLIIVSLKSLHLFIKFIQGDFCMKWIKVLYLVLICGIAYAYYHVNYYDNSVYKEQKREKWKFTVEQLASKSEFRLKNYFL